MSNGDIMIWKSFAGVYIYPDTATNDGLCRRASCSYFDQMVSDVRPAWERVVFHVLIIQGFAAGARGVRIVS